MEKSYKTQKIYFYEIQKYISIINKIRSKKEEKIKTYPQIIWYFLTNF